MNDYGIYICNIFVLQNLCVVLMCALTYKFHNFTVAVNRKPIRKSSKKLAKVQLIAENWAMNEMIRSHQNQKQQKWLHPPPMLKQSQLKH